mgnify:CR=1 FL=1
MIQSMLSYLAATKNTITDGHFIDEAMDAQTCLRAFKEIFDEPIYQWILGKKADRLKERLSGEEVNLKEIIYEFGFSSPAHFTKFCKKWLGMTPTKFIEEQKIYLMNLSMNIVEVIGQNVIQEI